MGTYDYGWPQLEETPKPSAITKALRHEPFHRTGELRDCIEHKVIDASKAEVSGDNVLPFTRNIGPKRFSHGHSSPGAPLKWTKGGKYVGELFAPLFV